MSLNEPVEVVAFEELWEEMHMHLQQGIPDLQTLQRIYNSLEKVMSKGFVLLEQSSNNIIDKDLLDYSNETRRMILQNMHYKERDMIRRLSLPKAEKKVMAYQDLLNQRLSFCKDVQRLLKDRLEAFRLDFQLSGGNYEI